MPEFVECPGCQKEAQANYYDGQWWCDDCIEKLTDESEEERGDD